jgi:hypothetical protein
MRFAITLTLAVFALAGCVTGPQVLGGSDADYRQMRADLAACERENFAFALIPDFGSTANFHCRKCMRQRGWLAGADRGSGIPDFYSAQASTCPKGYTWTGSGCSTETAAPTWATGE